MLCKNQVCWSTRHTWFAKIVPKETPNLNFHYKSTIFFSWEFIDVYTGSAELWDLNFAYDWSIEDHLFFSLNHLQNFHQMIGGGFTFWFGGKKTYIPGTNTFLKVQSQGQKKAERCHDKTCMKPKPWNKAGWVPILVTKRRRQKSAGRDILEKSLWTAAKFRMFGDLGKLSPAEPKFLPLF